ncbi:MAG: hypothetical protein KDI48_15865 [Xanthomonadales bacterium]|nr:hypothetical protein [Xanthomonadales bacterium]
MIRNACMHLLAPALLLLTVFCAWHAVRSGRTSPWLWILIIAPGLGAGIYILTQVLPEFFGGYTGRKLTRKVADTLNPTRERKRIEQELKRADTLENRRQLAEECLRLGDFEYAEMLFADGIKGVYADDPVLLYGLARSQVELGKGSDALETLDKHDQSDAQHRSVETALLRARALELSHRHDDALVAYEQVADRIPGEEGRLRLAKLLIARGRQVEALERINALLERAELQPKYYRREQADWLSEARQLRKQLQE